MSSRRTLRERIEDNSIPEPNSGCRLWLGCTTDFGHGRITVAKKARIASRMVWIDAYGPLPDGIRVLHKCDVPSCVNAAHLFLGTDADNVADMIAKGRKVYIAGEDSGTAKLTAEDVRAIRRDPRGHKSVARKFKISKSMVSLIRRREAWKHV